MNVDDRSADRAPRERIRPLRGSLATLAFLTTVVLLTGCISPGASRLPDLDTGEDVLTVMTFNIRMLFPDDASHEHWIRRRESIVDLIRRQGAALVTLQEVEDRASGWKQPSTQLQYLKHELSEYSFACADEAGTLSKQPILYDADRLTLVDQGHIFFSRSALEPLKPSWNTSHLRLASWARFHVNAALETRSLLVVNVHYDHLSGSSQRNSSRILTEFLADEVLPDEPVVVLGDFNVVPGSPVLDPLLENGLTHALPPSRTGSYHFFSGVTLWPRIDHVLINSRLVSLGGDLLYDRYEDGYPSDHFPAVAFLMLR